MNPAPYKIVHEQLSADGTSLTNIYFRYGGNFFVFSYLKDGVRKHTLIDAGDIRFSSLLPTILTESKIDPKNIERIIITHSHPDHYGLAHLLVKGSAAKILVHSGFKKIIEVNRTGLERTWLGLFNTRELRNCNVEYLSPQNENGLIDIGGIKFPPLVKPLPMGNAGKLEVLAIPESAETHTRDQVIMLFSARDYSRPDEPAPADYRPSDDMLFSGDLWLMRGPLFDRKNKSFSFFFRRGFFRIRRFMQGKGWHSILVMEQDLAVKEALKGYFSLIRVKPGHGTEFLGSRILPLGLPADRDLYSALGYPDDYQPAEEQPDARLANLLEQAYAGFIREALFWQEQGYTVEEIEDFLVRIYKEQTGGSKLVAVDRKQRRERMKVTLSRLQNDAAVPQEIRQLAVKTLQKLSAIS